MDGSKDLVHGPIMRRMLFFALPLAFASVLQQLYNTADVVVAGVQGMVFSASNIVLQSAVNSLWSAAMAECAIARLMPCAIVLPLGPLILSSMSADPEVIGDAMERLWQIVPGYALAVPMEVLSGALRGWSLPPALATLGCVFGSRMIWIFTVFNEHPLYDVLLAIYHLSWALTLPFIIDVLPEIPAGARP